MGWFSNKINQWSIKSQKKELSAFIEILRSMDGTEIGLVVAHATHMRHALEINGHNFMDPIIYAQINPGFIISLRKIIVDFQKEGRFQDAAALMVWLHTLRAGLFLDLRGLTREMWGQLSRGFPYVLESSINFRDLSGATLNISGASQFPAGFTPTPR